MGQRINEAEDANNAGQLPVMLVTLTLRDGHALRVATQAIRVATATDLDGPYDYLPLVAGVSEFDEELNPFALDGAAMMTQARIDVTTTDDLALAQGDWYAVTASTVEIAILWQKQAWEHRVVLLGGGRIQSIQFGVVGQPTTFSVEAAPPATSANICDDSRDLGSDFPSPQDNTPADLTALDGMGYPRVIGDPDSVPGFKIGASGGNNRLLLCDELASLTAVTVYEDGVSIGTMTPVRGTATSGGYAYLTHATRFSATDGAWTWKAANGGVHASNNQMAAALNADGLIRYLLTESGLLIDWRRMERTLQLLRGWRLGIYRDKQAAAIDIVRDIAKVLPLIEVPGGDGLWFAFADPHRAPIEADLTVGQEIIGRVGRMETTDLDEIRNQFSIAHSYEAFSGEYQEITTLDSDTSALCALSQQLYGLRADDAMESKAIWESVTGRRCLMARADRLCLPRRRNVYQLAPDAYWLMAGMVVRVTDADLGITSQRAAITSVSRSMMPFQAAFEFVDRTAVS